MILKCIVIMDQFLTSTHVNIILIDSQHCTSAPSKGEKLICTVPMTAT